MVEVDVGMQKIAGSCAECEGEGRQQEYWDMAGAQPDWATCQACGGWGTEGGEDGPDEVQCAECGGTGRGPCQACGGKGWV